MYTSHSPKKKRRISTLEALVKIAFLISPTKNLLQTELKYLLNVFCNLNQYPKNLVQTIIENETKYQERQEKTKNIQSTESFLTEYYDCCEINSYANSFII